MITGIGTPSSQSSIPRPIIASSIPRWMGNAWGRVKFRQLWAAISDASQGCEAPALPVAGVGHRRPRLCRRLRIALLQKFDRVQVGRAHESHLAVTRRAVDRDAELHQMRAGRVDIVNFIGEMTEVAILAVFFFIPV